MWPFTSEEHVISYIHEAESYLLRLMVRHEAATDCSIVVYLPHRDLMEQIADIGIKRDKDRERLTEVSWSILNDAMHTNVPLYSPPFVISLAAIHMASSFENIDITTWLAKQQVDAEALVDIMQALLNYYRFYATVRCKCKPNTGSCRRISTPLAT
ncbi:uncharacterized protein MONBRDRAFT_29942 [Monosiga brevicollis MX1]|uniref:Cyclin C-terminal domain-containing protein n=1 Tax=Monosiga brevicollis TaxID=81824 RepID=A9VCK3_MONBE|nr:uncharacterized protein MONBRDRAFT_29942 [Monosiga brevicollis MX1]EDQ84801.1 predicted protein [Monosiga brevicollis MX1]|eukprot:XP_001750451.1 hypothetical protein [Monosiga brevicollis MX1]